MKHEDFQVDGENIKLYASQHFCVLKSKGDPDYYFTIALAARNVDAEEEEIVPGEIQGIIEHGIVEPDDIEIARNLVEIDDDNEPAPENMPQTGGGDPTSVFAGEWGHPGICHCHMGNAQNQNPKLNFPYGVRPTLLQLFELLFPKAFILSVIIPMINKGIQSGGPVEYLEFLHFLGLWFLMATIQGPQ